MPSTPYDRKLAETTRWLVAEVGDPAGEGYLYVEHKPSGATLSLGHWSSGPSVDEAEKLQIDSPNANIMLKADGDGAFYIEVVKKSDVAGKRDARQSELFQTMPVTGAVGFAGEGRDQPFAEPPGLDPRHRSHEI